jgi:WD repeat-containing protein 48
MAFIFDKLELGARGRSGSIVSINSRITPQPRGQATSALTNSQPTQSMLGSSPPTDSPFPSEGESFNPEDVIELVCNMQTVDPKITLATLKHYYGSGGDMLLHYKLKEGVMVR